MLIMALLRMVYEKPVSLTRLPNGYCGDHPTSDCDICKERPWWRVEFENVGPVTIGWRKRVIVINWKETGIALNPQMVTTDDVTKSEFDVDAWGYGRCIEYLTSILHMIRCLRSHSDEELYSKYKPHKSTH